MKPSGPFIAAAVVALLPLSGFAGNDNDKDKDAMAHGSRSSAQFDSLDTNRDGRISRAEAAADTTITFTTADTNRDGYLDTMEYMHGKAGDSNSSSTSSSQSPESASPNSPGASSKTDPNQQQGTQPATAHPDEPRK